MPMYDMICTECQKEFSLFCSWQKKEEAECPDCKSKKVQQLYKSVAIGKGSGGGSSRPASSGFS